MVRVRQTAEFKTDFPDDQIEKDGEIVRFGGANIAAAIGDMLGSLGAEVGDPIYAEENGWELDIKYKGRNPWCRITDTGDTVFLALEDRWPPMFKDHPAYVEMVGNLNLELQKDGRFHDVQWYARKDRKMKRPATASPFDN